MLRQLTDMIKSWLGVTDDVVAMGLLVLILGAIGNILTLDLKLKT